MNYGSGVKEAIRTSIALAVYILGVAFLRARMLRAKQPLVRVLLIHHIKDEQKFERMIRHIARNYNAISFDDLLKKRLDSKKINVLLTMDDGYESWYTKGLPILERHNVPALFFIPSGFIDCARDHARVEQYSRQNLKLSWTSPPLTKDMLAACAEHPLITIGGHTCSHGFLALMPEADAFSEIAEDRSRLTEMLGTAPTAFAYPFGNYDDLVRGLVARAGYTYAMTTRSDFYRTETDPYTIPRSNHGTVSTFMLSVWIAGAYDIVETLEQNIRGVGRDGRKPAKK